MRSFKKLVIDGRFQVRVLSKSLRFYKKASKEEEQKQERILGRFFEPAGND